MWLQQVEQNSNKKSAHISCNTPSISPLLKKAENHIQKEFNQSLHIDRNTMFSRYH